MKNKKRLLAVIGGIAVLVTLVILIMLGNNPRPRDVVFFPYTVDSADPYGIKAFVTLLDKYYDVKVFHGDMSETQKTPLPDGSGTLMIMVEPLEGWREKEADRWVDWIKQGNSLWLIGYSPSAICQTLLETVPKDSASAPDNPSESGLLWGGDSLDGTYQARTQTLAPERLVSASGDKKLLWDDQGVICLARSYGDGELMALSSPEWMQNAYILDYDHVKILTFLLARDNPQRICFFEDALSNAKKQAMMGQVFSGQGGSTPEGTESDSDHGASSQNTDDPEIPIGIYYIIIIAIVLVLLELWRRGLRFGVAEIPRAQSVRFGDERIRALGSWYQRRGFYREALIDQANYVKSLMWEKWGVASWQDAERLRGILTVRLEPTEVEPWMHDFQIVCHEGWPVKMKAREYAVWAKRMSKMQATIDK